MIYILLVKWNFKCIFQKVKLKNISIYEDKIYITNLLNYNALLLQLQREKSRSRDRKRY